MLGLSAAALLSLGSVSGFHLRQGAALLFYALGLGALFMIKKYLAEKTLNESADESQLRPEAASDQAEAGSPETA